ncbi:MAG: LytTR family transcriptional regulator DNA-binding domain-containing protein [Marinicellaceae bacterium]
MQLVCFKTCDNYLEVYYLDEANVLKNRMIRSSMKKIESQLNASQFYRCHQSYLVNLAYVKGLKKVKNTHFLEMAYVNFDVSISRKNLKNIKTFLVS